MKSAVLVATLMCLAMLRPPPAASGSARIAGPDHNAARADRTSDATPAPSPCRAHLTRQVDPPRVAIGDSVTVTLAIVLDCPDEPLPLDVALVIDRSPSMKGAAIADARAAASQFVNAIDVERHAVGIASFHNRATIDARLSGDRRYVLSAIHALEVPLRGGTDIADGLRAGGRILTDDRARSEAGSVLILLSDGQNNYGPLPVLQSAQLLRRAGVHIVTVALGGAADAELLAAIASSPDDALRAPFSRDLRPVFARIAERMASIVARDVDVADRLPESMGYVRGSSRPEATFDGRSLAWRLPLMPLGGVELRWRLRPTELGTQPVSSGGEIQFVDSLGRPGSAALPNGRIEVVAPSDLWTSTPSASASTPGTPGTPGTLGTPSATPDPSSTPPDGRATEVTPVGTPPERATPSPVGPGTQEPPRGTPRPGAPTGVATARAPTHTPTLISTTQRSPRYLPWLGSAACVRVGRPQDVVLALDVSTTMLRPGPDGRPLVEVAGEAARDLASLVLDQIPGSRVGLVTFHEQARPVVGLTDDHGLLSSALTALGTDQGSRIDRGLAAALAAIRAGPDLPAADHRYAAIVLVTDGEVVGATEAAVIARAEEARDAGVTVWVVDLGDASHRTFLAEVAGGTQRRIHGAQGDRIVQALRTVGNRLRCP